MYHKVPVEKVTKKMHVKMVYQCRQSGGDGHVPCHVCAHTHMRERELHAHSRTHARTHTH